MWNCRSVWLVRLLGTYSVMLKASELLIEVVFVSNPSGANEAIGSR